MTLAGKRSDLNPNSMSSKALQLKRPMHQSQPLPIMMGHRRLLMHSCFLNAAATGLTLIGGKPIPAAVLGLLAAFLTYQVQ